MKKLIFVVGILLAVVTTAQAAEIQFSHEKGDRNVNVQASETHKNLYAFGVNVDINGNTTGDLVAAGAVVTINGNVERDLETAGGNLNLNGSVGGSLRAAGGNLSVNSPVAEDVLVAGGNVSITSKASVGGDLLLAGGNITVNSPVAGTAKIFGGAITINGQINGDLFVRANQDLTFGPNSVVKGTITYEGPKPATVQSGAQVGTVNFTQVAHKGFMRSFAGLWALATLIKLIGLLLAGFAIFYFFPTKTTAITERALTAPWASLGIGLVTLIVTPIIAVILMITILGLYIGMILLVIYGLMLILATVLMLFYVGALCYSLYQKHAARDLRIDLLIGAIVCLVLNLIPFLGWIVLAAAYLITFGALVMNFKKESV